MRKQSENNSGNRRAEVRILVIDDVTDHAELISVMLKRQSSRFNVQTADSVEDAISQFSRFSPDLVLTDYSLGPHDCFDVLKALKKEKRLTPVIILTGQGDENVAAEAIGEGAYDYLIKDQVFTQTGSLVKSIDAALERHELQQALRESEELYRTLVENILVGVFIIQDGNIVFSNPAFLEITQSSSRSIHGNPFRSMFIVPDRKKIDLALDETFVSGVEHRGRFVMAGPETKPRIHVDLTLNRVHYAGFLSIIGTAKDITSQVETEQELQQMLEEKKRLSVTDELTGLFNRRHALESLQTEITRSKRYGNHLSVIMFDLDNFKQINDSQGHLAGDKALRRVAEVMGSELRETDIGARYGGDEFLVIMPHTNAEQATSLAERIRERMKKGRRSDDESSNWRLTPSIGVAEVREEDDSAEALIARADAGLMQAKKGGKDQVVFYQELAGDSQGAEGTAQEKG